VLSWLEALAAAACAADRSSWSLLTADDRDAFSACSTTKATWHMQEGGHRRSLHVGNKTPKALLPPPLQCHIPASLSVWHQLPHSLAGSAPCASMHPHPLRACLRRTCSTSTWRLRSKASSLQASTCDSSCATRTASTSLLLPVSAAAAAAARRAWLASRSCCRAASAAACAAASLDSNCWT
jgi:hypothetical protein